MRIRPIWPTVLLAMACATGALAEISAGLRDASARIDYGWYTGDGRLILAARDELAPSAREPWSLYLRAYAAYRAGQLDLARGVAAGQSLASCAADAETAAADESVAAEATVLVVACSAMAADAEPLRAVFHQRRLRQGLALAEALAAGNPRLLLVQQRHIADAAVTIEEVVSAFRNGAAGTPFLTGARQRHC